VVRIGAPHVDEVAVRIAELTYAHRFGQLILRRPCGLAAGFAIPQLSIHRGRLQSVLYEAVVERLGAHAVRTGHRLALSTERYLPTPAKRSPSLLPTEELGTLPRF
jgi:hypothetical protein